MAKLIGYQSGVEAARARMKRLDPGGFNTQGTGGWDKFFDSFATVVIDHDEWVKSLGGAPPPDPVEPPPAQTYIRVAPRVAYAAGGSDARFCIYNQPGVTLSGNEWRDESGATYDENGLCKNGVRSGGPALTSAREIDGRDYCSLPRVGDPLKNTGSWAV